MFDEKARELNFRIEMPPTPKASVRFSRNYGSFLPEKTRVAMHDIKMHCARIKDKKFMDGEIDDLAEPYFSTAIEVNICYSFLRPKSVKPSKRPYPSVKPDIDNLAKLILDALQPEIIKDDALVVTLNQKKIYSSVQFIDVEIREKV